VYKSVPWLYLTLGLAQAAHSVEEIYTHLYDWMPRVSGVVHQGLKFIPVLHPSADWFVSGNVIIVAVILSFSPFVFQNRNWAWVIATVVAVIETLNAVNHLSAALIRGGYFSGCITAVLLLGLSIPIWARKWLWHKENK
jgi:VIT1/CCC1 family predicted Fe2+/Mn2+ transporter